MVEYVCVLNFTDKAVSFLLRSQSLAPVSVISCLIFVEISIYFLLSANELNLPANPIVSVFKNIPAMLLA